MTQRKAITLVLTGAAVLLIATLSATAERTTDDLPEIKTVSIEDENQDLLTKPSTEVINEDRRFDDSEYPPENEDLIIAPNPDDHPDNLVAPEPGAEGDVFILGEDNLVRPEEDADGDVFILDDEETPENLVAPKTGAKGDVFILNDENIEQGNQETKDQSFQMITFPPIMIGIFLGFVALVFVLQKKKQ